MLIMNNLGLIMHLNGIGFKSLETNKNFIFFMTVNCCRAQYCMSNKDINLN